MLHPNRPYLEIPGCRSIRHLNNVECPDIDASFSWLRCRASFLRTPSCLGRARWVTSLLDSPGDAVARLNCSLRRINNEICGGQSCTITVPKVDASGLNLRRYLESPRPLTEARRGGGCDQVRVRAAPPRTPLQPMIHPYRHGQQSLTRSFCVPMGYWLAMPRTPVRD